MDFSFNQDQRLIVETADAFLLATSTSHAVRSAMATESGYDLALWQQITETMGWHLTHIPESFNGLGLGYVELCILFECMGRNLLCAPFFSTVGLGVNALLVAATWHQKTKAFEQIVRAGGRFSLAYAGAGRHWGCSSVSAEYALSESGVLLNGEYSYVIDGHTADVLIVAARKPGSKGDADIALFIVPADAPGVERRWTPSMDQTRKLAAVQLHDVEVPAEAVMQQAGAAGPLLNKILALASIAIAAEQLGVAEKTLMQTLDYITERKQFGRAVGSFQAMKHKAADMLTQVEAARSAVYYAACIADEFISGSSLATELEEAASIAKAYCCDAAFFNAGSAIQMHGGVGFTWEHDAHLYFKRAKAAQVSFGDTAWHKERLAQRVLAGV